MSYAPREQKIRQDILDAQLEDLAGSEPVARDDSDPRRRRVCRQAHRFMHDDEFADLRYHLRHVACTAPEEAPDLGNMPSATASEYVLFRAGATQMFRMIGRLAKEASDELVD